MPAPRPQHTAQPLKNGFKHAVALVLSCTTVVAFADPGNPCNVPASTATQTYVDLASNGGGFGCAPFPVGSGSVPTLRSNAAGTVAWWYCPATGGKWRLNWAAGTADSLSGKNLVADAQKVITAENPRAAFAEVSSRNVKLPMSDPKLSAVWCPFVGEMLSGAPKTPSPNQATTTPPRGTP